jgi:hypothetical protein
VNVDDLARAGCAVKAVHVLGQDHDLFELSLELRDHSVTGVEARSATRLLDLA